jgi:predicted HicB family RNase H-like nuclease
MAQWRKREDMKDKLNLYVDEKLIEEIKLQAVREKRSVSQIVEELIEGYLAGLKKRKGKS